LADRSESGSFSFFSFSFFLPWRPPVIQLIGNEEVPELPFPREDPLFFNLFFLPFNETKRKMSANKDETPFSRREASANGDGDVDPGRGTSGYGQQKKN